MADLTARLSEVADALKDLLADTASLGLTDVYYGDQELIPRVPSAAIEPAQLIRTLAGASFRTDNNFTVYILVYVSRLADTGKTRRDADVLCEDIAEVLHSHITLDGLVIHGHVTNIEPGYSIRSGVLMRSARITWAGMSKTSLANS